VGRTIRVLLMLAIGAALLWAPTIIVDGPGFVIIAKFIAMGFGCLFFIKGLVNLWGLIVGSPMFSEEEIEDMAGITKKED